MRDKELCESPRLCNDSAYQHADDCPVQLAQDALASAPGYLLNRAMALEFAAEKFALNWGDIPADEYLTLRLLQAERNRHEREQMEKAKQNGHNGQNAH